MTVREVGLRGGVGEDLAAVGAALERFVSRPRDDRPGEVVRGEMVGWRRLIDRMELEFSGMVTELAACGEVEWLGHNSPTDWVKEECHLTGTAAWNALVVGEQAARMPESTRALVAGEIGYAHLALMARTADWVAGLPVVAVDLLAAGRPDAAAAGAADPGAAAPGAPLPPTFDEWALLSRARGHSVAFDVAVSSLAISNIPSTEGRNQALSEAVRVLRAGGQLRIVDEGADRYPDVLRKAGCVDVVTRRLDWRTSYGIPGNSQILVSARKPT